MSDKFSSLPSVHVTSLLVSSGYLWVGTSKGAVLIYNIPYLHGLPMTTGKPFLASDGHTDAIRVLLDVHSSLDMPSARFDQFLSDEKVRKIGSFYKKGKSQSFGENETEEDENEEQGIDVKEDKETNRLSCSLRIDQSALPMVTDIIKRLEKPKGLSALSPLFNKRKQAFFPKVKPKPSKKSNLAQTKQTTPVINPLTSPVIDPPISSDNTSKEDSTRDGNTTPTNTDDTQMLSLTEALTSLCLTNSDDITSDETSLGQHTSISQNASDYETPVKIHTYDQVPIETLTGDGLESTSDPDITPERYQGDSLVSLGEGLYDNYKISTLTISTPGRSMFVNEVNNGHVFILTGGRGLVNFRPEIESSASSILNPQKLDVSASSIAFQIPK